MNKILLFLLIFFLNTSEVLCSIKAVAFDFGGVVATADRTELIQLISRSFQLTNKEAMELLTRWGDAMDEGQDETLFWQACAASHAVHLPCDWHARLLAAQVESLHPIAETLCMIQKLQQLGLSTPLLSNTTPLHATIIRNVGYYDFFYPVLLSYEIGVRKPDPRAFQILLQSLNLQPSEVLFIDDQLHNVEAAAELGIHTIHFVHPENLEEALQKKIPNF